MRSKARALRLREERLRFVVGFFNESLPALLAAEPDVRFAVVRLDGDTFASAFEATSLLYPCLAPGGFVVIDDFVDWVGCADAIRAYRREHAIAEPIMLVPHRMDGSEFFRGAYWRKAPSSADQKICDGAPPGSLRTADSYNPPVLTRLTPALVPQNQLWVVENGVHACVDVDFHQRRLQEVPPQRARVQPVGHRRPRGVWKS